MTETPKTPKPGEAALQNMKLLKCESSVFKVPKVPKQKIMKKAKTLDEELYVQVADWMNPIEEQLIELPSPRTNAASLSQYEDEYQRVVPYHSPETETPYYRPMYNEQSTASLKVKLENTLDHAKLLAEILKAQILELSVKETKLKEAITNGRSGISTVTVSTADQRPRTYFIREGLWTLCTGIIEAPTAFGKGNLYNSLFSTPRCIGQEVPTARDPCAFNSVIKYETIPTQRRLLYTEDDYLCLKSSFNSTLEQYMSVPKRLINATCDNGIIRSLEDNVSQCGIRVLSEYSYYPHRTSTLPLEYCTEADGSCRLIVAWHVSNSTVENFEFLKNEQSFKKYFIKNGIYSPMMM